MREKKKKDIQQRFRNIREGYHNAKFWNIRRGDPTLFLSSPLHDYINPSPIPSLRNNLQNPFYIPPPCCLLQLVIIIAQHGS
jgi:hypothetical protein